MLRTKGSYHPFGSSPYAMMTKYIKLCTLGERKVFGLVGPIWMLVHLYGSLWSCGWHMVLFLLGPSTLTCVHLWLWWLLFYGMYCLLKTIGPCIVIITLCFGPFDPLMILVYPLYVFHLMLDLWPFTLWLLPLISYVLILLIKSLWFINKDLWTIKVLCHNYFLFYLDHFPVPKLF